MRPTRPACHDCAWPPPSENPSAPGDLHVLARGRHRAGPSRTTPARKDPPLLRIAACAVAHGHETEGKAPSLAFTGIDAAFNVYRRVAKKARTVPKAEAVPTTRTSKAATTPTRRRPRRSFLRLRLAALRPSQRSQTSAEGRGRGWRGRVRSCSYLLQLASQGGVRGIESRGDRSGLD